MRTSSHATTPRWPFWLLLAAWLCANSPQAATYAVLTWLVEARHFSHQQQLTFDVAHLLAGEKAATRVAVVPARSNKPAPVAPLAPTPDGAVLKKIDLSSERLSELALPEALAVRWARASGARSDIMRAPPPHGPPRTKIVS